MQSASPFLRPFLRFISTLIVLAVFAVGPLLAQKPNRSVELSRAVRPWEFLPSLGQRAALFGNESGQMEAWVYPLKLLRDFHLQFQVDGRIIAAESLARTVSVRPESSTIIYSGNTFTVRETFFVPIITESGAVILLDVDTETPLEISATFVRDFQLMWPAALGASYMSWDPAMKAFAFGEETKKFAGLLGSPTAAEIQEEYQTNYSGSSSSSFRLGSTAKGSERKIIVLAASMSGLAEAAATYQHLSADYPRLLQDSAAYYAAYLDRTVQLTLPDSQLQDAYDWSRISVIQGQVNNPYLGTGLVAGYRTSGESQRPGFAWFFGRDSLWTDLALISEGDFATTKAALQFVAKFQRDDGKIPHEIAQTASLVPWFKDYPYAYASADATPLYLITANEYVTQSGDTGFARENWNSLWKAYQFLRSTYDPQGFPRNFGFGHGWVEGGPLLPVKTEFYQMGLATEALRALSNLARISGKEDVAAQLTQEFERQHALFEKSFWLPDKNRYAFAIGHDGTPVDEPTVLATVPMWFDLLNPANTSHMITQLSSSDHQTDWGMRIISGHSSKFSGGGYHYGSVWPLFTGWAAVGEYRYHRAFPAYANLRANALLALDGSLGHVTEVLSGDSYQPLSTSSPHQIWSAAMVVSPLLRGLLGLTSDAATSTLTFAPHVPAGWASFSIRKARAGAATLDLRYERTADAIILRIACSGAASCPIDFEPAISLRAEVLGAELNGHPVPFHVAPNDEDQHVAVRISASSPSATLRIRVRNDFAVSYESTLPALGSPTRGLRILSESWSASRDTFTLNVAGTSGAAYDLSVWNPAQTASVEGGELLAGEHDAAKVRVEFPPSESPANATHKIIFHFSTKKRTVSDNSLNRIPAIPASRVGASGE
jgi:glycogen debranching enzyme